MADRKRNGTPVQKTEQKEVFETPSLGTSDDVAYDFIDKEEATPEAKTDTKEEVITSGKTKVIFREPTEEELPTAEVPRADGGFIGKNFFSDEQEWKSTLIGKTPNGAGLHITKRYEGVGYQLKFDGGMLPAKLSGWYTTFDKAQTAARTYLSQSWDDARAS